MRITLNGEQRDLDVTGGVVSVQRLLDALGLDARTVAVEVDRVVVKRDRYGLPTIREGAEVEIVAFVGGGHSRRGRISVAVPRRQEAQ